MAQLDIVPKVMRDEQQRHDDVLDVLRSRVRQAEAGELHGVLILAWNRDTNELSWDAAGITNRYEVAGHIEALKLKLLG